MRTRILPTCLHPPSRGRYLRGRYTRCSCWSRCNRATRPAFRGRPCCARRRMRKRRRPMSSRQSSRLRRQMRSCHPSVWCCRRRCTRGRCRPHRLCRGTCRRQFPVHRRILSPSTLRRRWRDRRGLCISGYLRCLCARTPGRLWSRYFGSGCSCQRRKATTRKETCLISCIACLNICTSLTAGNVQRWSHRSLRWCS